MNILFVNYGDFTSNSLNHIGGFARELSDKGHACAVAVPSGKESLSVIPHPCFVATLFGEALQSPELFPDGRGADIIHAWTPREVVRRFVIAYQKAAKKAAHLVIHLEDNEEFLMESYSGKSIAELRKLTGAEIDAALSDRLSNPIRYKTFLELADAGTVIVDRLGEFLPASLPRSLLQPGLEPHRAGPVQAHPGARAELGLEAAERVIVYTGSNTFANEADILELYRAVARLNKRGIRTRLVRTGFNRPVFQEALTAELKAHVIDLGFIESGRLPGLLSVADVLVQPGHPGPFDDYRLPSKLPEFLASGRPVVLPKANIALHMKDGVEALFLKTGKADDIADCCERIFKDPHLSQRLGRAGADFAARHFSLAANGAGLLALYERLLEKPAAPWWTVLRAQGGSDLTIAMNRLAERTKGVGADPELAGLASDLAFLVRTEDERQVAASDSALKKALELEEKSHHLELQRDLTERHAANLQQRLTALEEQLAQQERLASQHARNLVENFAAQEKQWILAKQMTDTHVGNLADRIRALESAVEAGAEREANERAKVQSLEAALAKQAAEVLSLESAVARQSDELQAAAAENRRQVERIHAIEKMARSQAEEAAAAYQRDVGKLQSEHAKLSARILEMDAELLARERRLKSIIQSRTYKLSAPLRDIERWLESRRPPREPAATGARAAVPEVPTPRAQPENQAPAVTGSESATPAPAPRAAYHYTYNFDHPRSWNTASNKLLILGWCYENSGAPIRGIRAQFAGETTEGIYGSKRLDVMASTGAKQAEYCGIKIDVRTHLGDHTLQIELLHDDGWHPFFQTIVHVGKAGDPTEATEYEKWCAQHEMLTADDRLWIKEHIAAFRTKPVISVLVPVYNPPEGLLEKSLQSVVDQLYPHWELCIADDASTEPHVRPVLEKFAASDPRIRVVYREKNGHICEASNTALDLVTGDYVALFDHDDVLAPTALYEIAAEIDANPHAKLLYSDEDKIDGEDRRFDPYFKPDWNPELIYGQNYISHLTVYKADLLRELEGFRPGYEGSQDWDLLLRAIERIPSTAIRHVPKLLYHWRAIPGSTALQISEKSYPLDAARRALEDHFRRMKEAVELLTVPGDHWRVRYALPSPAPLVSIIIPTRNGLALLRQALTSILHKTDYPAYEIVIVDNGSDDPEILTYFRELQQTEGERVRVLPYNKPFNYSSLNNFAVSESRGDVLCLLNNDIEVINADWLGELVSHAVRPGVGAVGAMLYYPLDTVQHAGVILGLGGVAGHAFKEFPRGDQGQKNRLRLVQNYSAVTGACLAVLRTRYLEVGGLNEEKLAVAFNDVDLCCKLMQAGYRNVWTPYAELYHHESASRGVEDTPEKRARFQSEVEYMMETWKSLLESDPAYNPNLTLVGEDFTPAYLSRVTKPWINRKK